MLLCSCLLQHCLNALYVVRPTLIALCGNNPPPARGGTRRQLRRLHALQLHILCVAGLAPTPPRPLLG
ncbi:hypothetical protein PR002_g15122 [Phytophthora rubi]|uniref:Uncharacterized protein n=1 Tax=Phytophthora rubi TaxID=129364 RepID=A0A6A3L0B4_9STRA|nr:hypothetical protein PR002_g15122 [Phytophthora rubi]